MPSRRRPLLAIATLLGLVLLAAGLAQVAQGIGNIQAGGRHHIAGGTLLILAGALATWIYGRKLAKQPLDDTTVAPAAHGDRLCIAASKSATTHLIVSAVLMCLTSLAIMVLPWVDADPGPGVPASLAVPIGLAGLLFFGACLVWIVQRRLDARGALVADRLGLYDGSTAFGTGERVPWHRITGFHPLTFMGQAFVAVELAHPRQFIDQARGLRRLALSANLRMVGTPWCITAATLGWNAAALAAALEAHRTRCTGGSTRNPCTD